MLTLIFRLSRQTLKILRIFIVAVIASTLHMFSQVALAEKIQIEFTEDDSYSVNIARIKVGDTIEWLPKHEGHNVEFLAGPQIISLPPKSNIDDFHSVVFTVPGVYLYGCTPHKNMGMLGLVIVGKDLHNLDRIKQIDLSPVANSVLKRLIKIAQSH